VALDVKYMKQNLLNLRWHLGTVGTVLFGAIFTMGHAFAAVSIPSILPQNISSPSDVETAVWCPIIGWMFWILMSIAVIMVLYAAYLYVTAGEDTEQVHRATKTITYAAVAIAVALIAVGFPNLIGTVFGNTTTAFSPGCATF
jgi:Type IV secretion system pilin